LKKDENALTAPTEEETAYEETESSRTIADPDMRVPSCNELFAWLRSDPELSARNTGADRKSYAGCFQYRRRHAGWGYTAYALGGGRQYP
jgi:hypothetical protein